MKEKLAKIREEILKQIDASENLDKLNEVRVSALGKKGALTELLKSMKEVAPQDRPKVGQMVNEVRAEIETALETEKAKLEDRAMEARLKNEVIDVTLPAKKNSVGHRHPNTIALEEVERIFVGIGYEVVRGPEVEKDYYNFEGSLTTPPCTEGVNWIVFKNQETVSKEQVEKFTQTLGFENNRPIQDTNGRKIKE